MSMKARVVISGQDEGRLVREPCEELHLCIVVDCCRVSIVAASGLDHMKGKISRRTDVPDQQRRRSSTVRRPPMATATITTPVSLVDALSPLMRACACPFF